jgi:hypothetical protein
MDVRLSLGVTQLGTVENKMLRSQFVPEIEGIRGLGELQDS